MVFGCLQVMYTSHEKHKVRKSALKNAAVVWNKNTCVAWVLHITGVACATGVACSRSLIPVTSISWVSKYRVQTNNDRNLNLDEKEARKRNTCHDFSVHLKGMEL